MNFCSQTYMNFYELFGIVLMIFKYFIPFIIILIGTIDLFKSITNIKEKKKHITRLLKRIIIGVLIFFLPSIILEIFNRVGLDNSEFSCMYKCVLEYRCK